MSGFAQKRKSTPVFNYGNEFNQKTTHFATAGRAHCLAIAYPKLVDHAWRHVMARRLYIYPELFQRTHRY